MRAATILLGAACLGGCNAFSGIGDLSFEVAGAGAAGTSGAPGSSVTAGPGGAGSGGGRTTSSSGGGGASMDACGGWTALGDDFEDVLKDEKWSDESEGGGLVSEQAGNLLALLPAEGVDATAAYGSKTAHDLTACAVWAEVATVAEGQLAATFLALLEAGGETGLVFVHMDGDLRADRLQAGMNPTTLATIEYAPDEHRWWRILEQAGKVAWQTSPDGLTWLVIAEDVSPPRLEYGLGFGASKAAADPEPSKAEFASVNVPAK